MKNFHHIFGLLFIFLLSGCGYLNDNRDPIHFEELVPMNYAQGLSIYKTNEGYVVTIKNPQTGEILDHFIVTDKEQVNLENTKVITSNFSSILAYSSTYISFLDALGKTDLVTGVSYAQGITNKTLRNQLATKKTVDVGSDQSPDKELILSLKPNLALIYPANGNHDWFTDFDVPTVTNVEYLEVHPLAQAEWIKLYGALFNKMEEATALFDSVALDYNLSKCLKQTEKPVVLCGELYDNIWTLPGGQSTTSQLISDAGGAYFYNSDTTSGSKKLDFEYILAQDSVYDYWLLLTYNQQPITYSYLKQNKPRYSYLQVFSPNKMAVCNTAKSPYFETGILEPQVLLREIKTLIHQEEPLDSLKYFKEID